MILTVALGGMKDHPLLRRRARDSEISPDVIQPDTGTQITKCVTPKTTNYLYLQPHLFFFLTNLKYPCIFFNSLVSIFNFYFIIDGQFTMLCATISTED